MSRLAVWLSIVPVIQRGFIHGLYLLHCHVYLCHATHTPRLLCLVFVSRVFVEHMVRMLEGRYSRGLELAMLAAYREQELCSALLQVRVPV